MQEKTKIYVKKFNRIILVGFFLLSGLIQNSNVQAATTQEIEPAETQYLEMRATNINEIEGQGKQVIFELWGHEIDFKRIPSSI